MLKNKIKVCLKIKISWLQTVQPYCVTDTFSVLRAHKSKDKDKK